MQYVGSVQKEMHI